MGSFLEIASILAVATFVAVAMQYFRLPLILGHILTGILVGPAALNLVRSDDALQIFSKLGITALLFIVGLSLSPHVLREVGKVAVLTGLGQIVFTTLLGLLLAFGFGYSFIPALFIAVALTFSSTIIILKLLSDRGDLNKLYGKISVGFLLVQDIAATLILIFVSLQVTHESLGQAIALMVAKMILILALVFAVSRWLLPHLARLFAVSQEFLFLFAIGWGVGLGAIFHYLGLSVEIGALAAGVALSSSTYRYEITAKMSLIRDFFLIMFFVLLGSQLSWGNIGELWPQALVFSAFILIGNPLIVMAIMGLMGYAKKTSFFAGLTVAQISEFSLVLIILGLEKGYVSPEVLSLVTIVGIATIAASTFMILKADTLYAFLSPVLGVFERRRLVKERNRREQVDVLLFGCHRMGRDFIHSFKKLGYKFLVVDFDPTVIEQLERAGVPCRYGDAHDNDFLEELNIKRAKIIVSTIPEYETNMFLLSKIRKVNDEALLILSAQSMEQTDWLYEAGADYVIAPHFLGGNHTAMLLERYGDDRHKFSSERRHHLAHLKKRAVVAA